MKESKRTKYLYVVSNPSFSGYYKIGVTSDFHQRLSNYNTGDPYRAYKLELIAVPKSRSARDIEQEFMLNNESKYEWFQYDSLDDMLADVYRLMGDDFDIIEYKRRQHGGYNGNASRNCKSVSINGVVYSSLTKAHRELNKSIGWLHYKLNDDNQPNYEYL